MQFLGTQFSFKNWCFFYLCIDHGLDLILYWKTCNYWKVNLLNLKMSLCAWWPIFLLSQKTVLIKIYFRSLVYSKQNTVVMRFEFVSDIKLSLTLVFTALILLGFFQIIKICQCCGFTLTNVFPFFSWVTFLNTRIFFAFFLF